MFLPFSLTANFNDWQFFLKKILILVSLKKILFNVYEENILHTNFTNKSYNKHDDIHRPLKRIKC